MPNFIILLRASADSEAGKLPSTEVLTAMGKYNQQLTDAGILLSGEGLHPTSKGARVTFSSNPDANPPSVSKGPFPNLNEIIGGYWVIKVANLDEAVGWVKKCPIKEEGLVVEVRQIASMDDFGDAFTDELKAQEAAMRAAAEKRAGGA
jgi:hypothetical protein